MAFENPSVQDGGAPFCIRLPIRFLPIFSNSFQKTGWVSNPAESIMHGWRGKILFIDLTEKKAEAASFPDSLYRKLIGGRGLGGHFLRERIHLPWDDPGMPILLFTGPLTGTLSPTPGRMTVMSRSPLTGTVGDASVGGSLGKALKETGFDGIVITGKSGVPMGIEIAGAVVGFRDAERLRGKTVGRINRELAGKGANAVTGPAADNGVLFSSVVVDGHFVAGRNGIGSSFAAKNLKFITIKADSGVREGAPERTAAGEPEIAPPGAGGANHEGNEPMPLLGSRRVEGITGGKIPVFDHKGLKAAREDIFRLISASPVLAGEFGIARFGTGALYDLMDARKMMPTANFRASSFHKASGMNAHAFKRRYNPRSTGCQGCHIRCKKVTEGGKSLPEYETMSHFSALLENSDIETVMAANEICNEMGMDTITAGATLSCYAEIIGKKLSPDEILSLLRDIALGRGKGAELSTGSAAFATKRGRREASISVKKQELPAYDPRGAYGMALAFAVSTRGGCHLRAYPISHEILRKPVATDRFSFAGKARIIKIGEDINAVADSLTACKFTFFAASLEEYARVFTAVTGVSVSAQDLLTAGERICCNERLMNAACGFDDTDDDLPPRFFEDSGDGAAAPIDRQDFLDARKNYYKVRGLDDKGRPLPETLKKLGLE